MTPPSPQQLLSPATAAPIDHRQAVIEPRANFGSLRKHVPRPGLVAALVLSIALHAALSFWPAELETVPDSLPLQASIVEMPPPPLPAAAAPAKPRPRPQRPTAPRPHVEQPAAPVAEEAAKQPEPPPTEPTPEAIATGPEPATEVVAESRVTPENPPKTLPRRVDLVYKAFLGSQGLLIGEAVYRFEHSGNEYHILTIGEAKGLAALFLRGQGKLESRGLITSTGLRPYEFTVERGGKDRRETALFDWEIGMVTLHEDKTVPLELSTYDPMTLMWQAYFTPPVDAVQEISVATTRRIARYTLTREAEETIPWAQGDIVTERWRRQSEDGNNDTTVWLAPSLRYVPVKMRVITNYKSAFGATIEATLDSIRVDEPLARQ